MDRYSSCFESHHPATLVVSIRSTLLFSGDMLTIVQSVACTLFGKPWGVYPLKAKPRRNLAPEVSGGGRNEGRRALARMVPPPTGTLPKRPGLLQRSLRRAALHRTP